MNDQRRTAVVPASQLRAGLAALAFGARSSGEGEGSKHLAFLPLDVLELDLTDPEQCDFGDYELQERLGQGGMGVVYRARQKSLERDVAIKLLSAGPWASPAFIARFTREARSAARLTHPNIVPIFEIGAHDELNFFSMGLVRGESLAQRLDAGGPLPPREAAALARTVAEALDYAHRLGILHLDLKPGNVLIDEHGEPHVADFGLAQHIDETLSSDGDEIAGTPSYMAPEQVQARYLHVGVATDVYGLGAILYEALTGHPPFLGESARQTLEQVVATPLVAPRQRDHRIPEDLEAICLKCLAKDVAPRYASMRAVADDLQRFVEGRAVSVRPLNIAQRIGRWARREPRVAGTAAAAALALLVGLGAATWQWQRAESSADSARQRLWQDRLDQAWDDIAQHGPLTALPALVENLAEQESGGDAAAAQRSRARLGALLAHAPQLIDQIDVGEHLTAVALDPRARWIATTGVSGVLRLHDVADGALRCEVDARAAQTWARGAWFQRLIASADGDAVLAIPYPPGATPPDTARRLRPLDATPDTAATGVLVDTRDCRLRAPSVANPAAAFTAHLSPDGEFGLRIEHDADVRRIAIVRSDDGAVLRSATFPPASDASEQWWIAPGLARIARLTDQFSRVQWLDPATLQVRREHARDPAARVRAYAWRPGGDGLALGWQDGRVELFDGRDVVVLEPQVGAATRMLEFSADGAWLAAAFRDGSVLVWNVRTRTLAGPPLRGFGEDARASPDPTRSAVLVRDGRAAQWWMFTGVRGESARLWRSPRAWVASRADQIAWNADAGLLATASQDGQLQLWRLPDLLPVAAQAAPLSSNEAEVAFDGRRVLDVDGNEVRVRDLDSGAVSPPLIHPQAVSFAVLAAEAQRVVVIAGAQLYVHTLPEGRSAFAPIALAHTPSGLRVHGASGTLLVSGVDEHEGRPVTRLTRYALLDGRSTGRAELPGTGFKLALARGATHVLAWRQGTVHVLDGVTLAAVRAPLQFGPMLDADWAAYARSVGPLPPPPRRGTPVIAADIGEDGRWLWVAVHGSEASDGPGAVHAIDLSARRATQRWDMNSMVGALRPFSAGERCALLLRETHEVRLLQLDGPVQRQRFDAVNAYAGTALSGDGRRLAVALQRGAAIFDSASGEWLSPPLLAQLPYGDILAGLSLDREGRALLVRTRARGWMRYRLPVEARSVAELRRLAALLQPDELAGRTPGALDARTRTALRAADRGPPAPQSEPQSASRAASAPPAPGEARFVDLRPGCSADPWERGPSDYHFSLARVLPPGPQRLLGRDFFVSCAVRAVAGERSAPIRLGQSHTTALHLLLAADMRPDDGADAPYAELELLYRDGTRAALPLRYRRAVWEWWMDALGESEARLAYDGAASRDSNRPLAAPALFAATLANPHPERELDSLVLRALDSAHSAPELLAVTLEPGGP